MDVLAVAIDGLRELGLNQEDFRARVSDRRLLGKVLGATGVPEDRMAATFAVVDKVERESRDRILDRLVQEVGLPDGVATALLSMLEAPGLEAVRDRFGDRDDVGEQVAVLDAYMADVEALGMGGFVSGPGGLMAWLMTAIAIRRSGGRPQRITPSRELELQQLSAVVIGGGTDVDPSLRKVTALDINGLPMNIEVAVQRRGGHRGSVDGQPGLLPRRG